MPSTPARSGSERASRRKIMRGVVAIRQAVEHAGGPLRPAVARIGTKAGKGNGLQPAKFLRRGLRRAGRFPNGRCDSRAPSACRRARAIRPACSGSEIVFARPRPDSSPCRHFVSARTDRRSGCSTAWTRSAAGSPPARTRGSGPGKSPERRNRRYRCGDSWRVWRGTCSGPRQHPGCRCLRRQSLTGIAVSATSSRRDGSPIQP